MIVEGGGPKAPAPVQVRLGLPEQRALYEDANKQCEFRHYGTSATQWGQGILEEESEVPSIGRLSRAARPIFYGKTGEYAVCRWLNARLGTTLHPDDKPRRFGDGGVDLVVFGVNIQVKTKYPWTKGNHVRVDWLELDPESIPADVFVFAHCRGEGLVDLLGWMWSRDLNDLPSRKSARGDWRNKTPEDLMLRPMSALVDELRYRKEWAAWR